MLRYEAVDPGLRSPGISAIAIYKRNILMGPQGGSVGVGGVDRIVIRTTLFMS